MRTFATLALISMTQAIRLGREQGEGLEAVQEFTGGDEQMSADLLGEFGGEFTGEFAGEGERAEDADHSGRPRRDGEGEDEDENVEDAEHSGHPRGEGEGEGEGEHDAEHSGPPPPREEGEGEDDDAEHSGPPREEGEGEGEGDDAEHSGPPPHRGENEQEDATAELAQRRSSNDGQEAPADDQSAPADSEGEHSGPPRGDSEAEGEHSGPDSEGHDGGCGEGEGEDFTLEDLHWACENMEEIDAEHQEALGEVCNFAADAAEVCEVTVVEDEFKKCMEEALFNEFGDMHL